jgi:hypothetical protein
LEKFSLPTIAAQRTRLSDLVDLIAASTFALERALGDGDADHPVGSWMQVSIEEHLKHIDAHLTAWQCGDRSEDHLSHILCRAAAACALNYRCISD